MQTSRNILKLWGLALIILSTAIIQPTPSYAQEETPEPAPESAEGGSSEQPETPEDAEEPRPESTPSPTEEPTVEPVLVPVLEPHQSLVSSPLIENNWSDPINLSATGSANRPTTLLDKNGILHIFWIDSFDGLTYMRQDGDWTQPVKLTAPFGLELPHLIVDEANEVHAFWLSAESSLMFSHAPAEQLHDATAWSGPVNLASDVVAFAAEIDAEGQLHAAFHIAKDSDNQKAGIYHRTRSTADTRWGEQSTIYQSPYLRLANQENSQVSIATTADLTFVAWTNPGRDWVMLASSDNRTEWSEAKIIDQRSLDDDSRSSPPSDPILFAAGDQIIISWHAGHGDFVCGRYFSQSNDGGKTFSPSTISFGDLYECPQQTNLVPLSQNGFLLLTRTDELTYLSVWQESEWQGRNIQPVLVQFREQETGRDVQLGCYQPSIQADRILIVGCDRNFSQDIWLTEYRLNELVSDVTTARIRETVVADDIDVTPIAEAEAIRIETNDIPQADNGSFLGSGNGAMSLALLLAGILVVAFGVFTLFRRK